MINYKAIQQPLATPVQRSLPINKLCDWLDALPNRPVLHFLLTCAGLAISVLQLQGRWDWLEDVTDIGETVCQYVILCAIFNLIVSSFYHTHTQLAHNYNYL